MTTETTARHLDTFTAILAGCAFGIVVAAWFIR